MIVHEPGTAVKLGDVPAVVAEVMISESGRVQYHVVWWAKSTRYCEWVSAFEVEDADDGDKLDIGFHAATPAE